ncbi:MAG: hypothetical protein AAF500_14360 [Myxococcota bacterium]
MRGALAFLLLVTSWTLGCSDRAACSNEASSYIDRFDEYKRRTIKLLELRERNHRRKLLADALKVGNAESLPPALRPTFNQMQREDRTFTERELTNDEASFWRLFNLMFSQDPDVLQGEIIFIERDESMSAYRYPSEREVPAGLRWHGMRQNRTFCAVADCLIDTGTEPCVLIQLRPRDYGGSAGLTVGFKRTP